MSRVIKGITTHVSSTTIQTAIISSRDTIGRSLMNGPTAYERNRLEGNTPHNVAAAIFQRGGGAGERNQASRPFNSRYTGFSVRVSAYASQTLNCSEL